MSRVSRCSYHGIPLGTKWQRRVETMQGLLQQHSAQKAQLRGQLTHSQRECAEIAERVLEMGQVMAGARDWDEA